MWCNKVRKHEKYSSAKSGCKRQWDKMRHRRGRWSWARSLRPYAKDFGNYPVGRKEPQKG